MSVPYASRVRFYGLVCMALLALSACDILYGAKKPAPKQPVKAAKVQVYDAKTFVEHLSIARITLENGGSASDIADDAKVIEAYTKQKKVKSTSLLLAVLEYTGSDGQAKRAIAPVTEGGNFGALSNVLTPLNSTSYKLKDVRIVGASVAPGLPVKISGQDTPAIKQAIDARHQAIAGGAHKIAAAKEASLQLKLVRFFMGAQQRDAAYICADNVKRLLSGIPKQESATTTQLAKELETTEGELRRTMPY